MSKTPLQRLLEHAQRNAEKDAVVHPLGPFCVMTLFPDGSAILMKNQLGRIEQIVLSRMDLENLKEIRLPMRRFVPGPESEMDVHTEHCCVYHGCKYRDDDCPVVRQTKKQSLPCESCYYDSEGYDQGAVYDTKSFKIVKIFETCGGCPSQWSARTDDNKYVYIRYRHGGLSVKVDDEEVLDQYFLSQYGGDGVLNFDELVTRTAGVLDFTNAVWVNTREEVE
jgi:hypothetical protein